MRSRKEIVDDLITVIVDQDVKRIPSLVNEGFDAGMTAVELFNALSIGMEEVGKLFDEAKIFLPQILGASKVMESAMDIIEPKIGGGNIPNKGCIIMGTVEGDIHQIGKNICCAMLRGAGYEVIDIGEDRSVEDFIDAAKKNNALIIGASALMTTTLMKQKALVLDVKGDNINVKVCVGGAPCSKEWADEIGADGYSASGADIVALVKKLLSSRS